MTDNTAESRDSASVLYLPLLLGSLGFTFLMFGLPIHGKSLGASAVAIGGLYSIFTVATMVLRPVVGWALDRYGRKRFFVAALACYSVTMGLFACAHTIEGLYLARLAQGIASSLMWISVNTITADLASVEGRGVAMGRVAEVPMRGGMYGVLVGFAMMSFLPDEIAWQAVFTGYALAAAAGAYLAWKRVLETIPSAGAPAPAKERSATSRQLFNLMVIVFTTGVSAAMISPIYLVFLQDKFTTDIMTLAWAFFPAGIVYSVLPSRLGGLSDRHGRAGMMAIGLIGAGLLSLLLPGLPSPFWLMVLYTLTAVGWSIADPAETAMVADLAGRDTRGRGYGVYDFVNGLGATIGPLLGGWLYDNVGRPVPFYLNGAVLVASAVWIVLAMRNGRRAVT